MTKKIKPNVKHIVAISGRGHRINPGIYLTKRKKIEIKDDIIYEKIEMIDDIEPIDKIDKEFLKTLARLIKTNDNFGQIVVMTSNPNNEDVVDSLAYGLKYNEEKYGVGGLHLYPKTTPYVDTNNVENMYPVQMKLYERLRNIPGTIAFRLSSMNAKDFINLRMYAARSKSKHRHAISPLNAKILHLAKSSHHYNDIKTIHDLKGMSRNGKIILLRMLKRNPFYGIMSDKL